MIGWIIYSAAGAGLFDLLDNRLDSFDCLIMTKSIEARLERRLPVSVYVHHSCYRKVYHCRLKEAVVTECRPTHEHVLRLLFSF